MENITKRDILFSDFNVGKLEFTAMEKIKLKNGENMYRSDVIYDGKPFTIKTPDFKLTRGGIYDTSKYARDFVTVPIDEDNPFKKILSDIDKSVGKGTKNAKSTLFKNINIKQAKQTPLINADASTFKVKFFMNYGAENVEDELVNKSESVSESQSVNGSESEVKPRNENVSTLLFVKGEPVEVKTVDDIAKHVVFGSTIQMVVVIKGIWADKSLWAKKPLPEKEFGKTVNSLENCYGVTLGVTKINVIEKGSGKIMKAFQESLNEKTFF